MLNVLLVEDDANMAFILKSSLEQIIGGYNIVTATDGKQGLSLFERGAFDIVVSDVEMPVMDGNMMVRNMRKICADVPVIMITAKTDVSDVIAGYDSGADMYIKKPFLPQELDAHIQALIRRRKNTDSSGDSVMLIGSYTFIPSNLKLKYQGNEIKLTSTEVKLLEILYHNIGEVVSRSQILQRAWGNDDYYTSRSLDVFVSKLRKYFSSDSRIHIDVYKGVGISLDIER